MNDSDGETDHARFGDPTDGERVADARFLVDVDGENLTVGDVVAVARDGARVSLAARAREALAISDVEVDMSAGGGDCRAR